MTIEGTSKEDMVDERCCKSEVAMTPDRPFDNHSPMDESCPDCDINDDKG